MVVKTTERLDSTSNYQLLYESMITKTTMTESWKGEKNVETYPSDPKRGEQ